MRFAKLIGAPALLATLALLVPGGPLRTQGLPPRPRLDPGRDTNSADSYYGYGLHILSTDPVKAEAAFIWATRLDPGSAASWYGRWAAAVMSLPSLSYEDYLYGSSRDTDRFEGVDSLKTHAEAIDPLLHEGLDYVVLERFFGERELTDYIFGHPDIGGWIAYSHGDAETALDRYARAIKRWPYAYFLHWERGRAFLLRMAYDSALAEMRIYRDSLRSKNEHELWRVIWSHEMTDYAIGRVEELRGHADAARQEYDTALVENLGFAPAHVALARMAVAHADTATALTEYEAATQVAEPVACYAYGVLLWATRHGANAAVQFGRAIAADSDYAPPYLPLALLEESAGDDSVAVLLYRHFIARAPQTYARMVAIARQHLDSLTAKGSAPR